MTDATSDGPFGLFDDRRRMALVAAVVGYAALFAGVVTPGEPLPTEATMTTLRWGFLALTVWGGLEYLRSRR